MIQLLYSEKGNGKTKKMIDMANEDVKTSGGNVVFIDDDKRCMYDVAREIRFVDITEYDISSECGLYGFISGMIAQNSDICSIYIDGFMKIAHTDIQDSEKFFEKAKKLTDENNIKLVMIVSADPAQAPEYLKGYIL